MVTKFIDFIPFFSVFQLKEGGLFQVELSDNAEAEQLKPQSKC
ncbi:hypothetical protein J2S10_004438 [Neobacillus ginsengisoli]|uniref:Uncharacterized protein n=1 Tax=Neobacillus ginsengisoli TaxID=904295 RepID=A0ABT9Y076_9BACI|nr:hypothetical protein [Neobacillus ginsengisoli]